MLDWARHLIGLRLTKGRGSPNLFVRANMEETRDASNRHSRRSGRRPEIHAVQLGSAATAGPPLSSMNSLRNAYLNFAYRANELHDDLPASVASRAIVCISFKPCFLGCSCGDRQPIEK